MDPAVSWIVTAAFRDVIESASSLYCSINSAFVAIFTGTGVPAGLPTVFLLIAQPETEAHATINPIQTKARIPGLNFAISTKNLI